MIANNKYAPPPPHLDSECVGVEGREFPCLNGWAYKYSSPPPLSFLSPAKNRKDRRQAWGREVGGLAEYTENKPRWMGGWAGETIKINRNFISGILQ